MNRLEVLIQKALDGELASDEERELEGLLRDGTNRDKYLSMLRLEASLRGLDGLFDVSERTITEVVKRAQPRAGRRAIIFVSAVAATTVLIAGVLWWLPRAAKFDASLVSIRGDVRIIRGDGRVTAGGADELQIGDRIETGGDATAQLKYSDGTTLDIEASSRLIVASDERNAGRGKKVRLVSGRLNADVAPQLPEQPMEIETSHLSVVVLGTTLQVRADADTTRVTVVSGEVLVRRRGEPAGGVAVKGGESCESRDGDDPRVWRSRVSEGLIAFYPFDEGTGRVVHDRSGVAAPLDLELQRADTLKWMSPFGVTIPSGSVLASRKPAEKIVEACRETGELTVEAWVTPAVSRQLGPARIVTMSEGSTRVNFMLAHGGYGTKKAQATFVARLRTARTQANGFPRLETPAGSVHVQPMHVVLTYSASGKRTLYLDGVNVASDQLDGTFAPWNRSLRLCLGNEFEAEDRPWHGGFLLVAIYRRALSITEVRNNYEAGIPADSQPNDPAKRTRRNSE